MNVGLDNVEDKYTDLSSRRLNKLLINFRCSRHRGIELRPR